MRRSMTVTAVVLVCALAICLLSLTALNRAVAQAGDLCGRAVRAVEERRYTQARSLTEELDEYWKAHAALLEMIVNHEALNDVSSAVAEAGICLECADNGGFLRAMSAAQIALENLRRDETLCWQNLY